MEKRKGIIRLERRKGIWIGEKEENMNWREGRE